MNELWWYTARSAGLVSAALLALSVILGLALSTAPRHARPRKAWRLDLHRYVGGLSVIFVGVHVVALMLDSFIHFGVVQVLVPFTSSWNPWAVSLGVVALYLLLAVELTSLARNRMPRRLWRSLHYLSFPLFVLAELHLLLAGTDAGSPLVLGSVAAVDVAIAALVARRVLAAAPAATTPRPVEPRPIDHDPIPRAPQPWSA